MTKLCTFPQGHDARMLTLSHCLSTSKLHNTLILSNDHNHINHAKYLGKSYCQVMYSSFWLHDCIAALFTFKPHRDRGSGGSLRAGKSGEDPDDYFQLFCTFFCTLEKSSCWVNFFFCIVNISIIFKLLPLCEFCEYSVQCLTMLPSIVTAVDFNSTRLTAGLST